MHPIATLAIVHLSIRPRSESMTTSRSMSLSSPAVQLAADPKRITAFGDSFRTRLSTATFTLE